MIRFKRPGPLVQMTLALVTMTISILLLADLLLGGQGDRGGDRQTVRQHLSESLAVQAAVLLQHGDQQALERSLREVVLRVKDLRSVGVRREDGVLMASAGPHAEAWQSQDAQRSTPDQVRVALAANGQAWGAAEFAYQAEVRPWWAQWFHAPLLRQLLFVAIVGALGFAMYMRRALQHLDPAAVIPERVQRAFDAMAEGVVVLDARSRVMLANRAFRAMGADGDDAIRIGQPLSAVPWLAAALPADVAAHPWARAMSEKANTTNDQLVVLARAGDALGPSDAHERNLVIACAPITDTGGAVRGCMATFNDMTALHRANAALHKAMTEVEAGKEELRRNNLKLQHLATRDGLTGCLNRRAFMDAAQELRESALQDGIELGCLMLDIDHFKSINDTHGHGVGDRVIAEVAQAMLGSVRQNDLVCRYGGEEFCILAPCLDAAGVFALGERIRGLVQTAVGERVAEVQDLRVTISVGCSVLDRAAEQDEGDTLARLIDRADQALYRAKRGGRNRVAQFTSAQEVHAPVDG